MTQGHFYFISDEFYHMHDPNRLLMQNKEGAHARPCFYAFCDPKNANILWCIPISSRVDKFEGIVQRKLEKQRANGIKKPVCNTILFGDVLGQRRAFLIQNMFPITPNYISSTYIDKNTNNPVTIDPKTEKRIVVNAKKVLKLVFHGHSNLIFSDIQKMHTDLIAELGTLQRDTIPLPSKTSMQDRMAAAQVEADRRNIAAEPHAQKHDHSAPETPEK